MSATESVALYDPRYPDGRVTGAAPRDQVRARNLPHAATAVLLLNPAGEIYLHRRSDAKDLWPGRHDCAAGGVVLAGEDPADAARRELAEELGVEAAEPVPLLRRWYRDPQTWYLGFVYTARWSGPVRFADGEVADGWWEPVERLYRRLTDPGWPFVPDTRALLELPQVRTALAPAAGPPGTAGPATRPPSPHP